MLGANLVIPAQICDELSGGQEQFLGRTDGRTDRQTERRTNGQTDRRRQRQCPFCLKGQGVKTNKLLHPDALVQPCYVQSNCNTEILQNLDIMCCYADLTGIPKFYILRRLFLCTVYDAPLVALRWRHHDREGISNHQLHDCLLNRLFRRRSNKTSKLRVTGLCEGNSPVTGEFPAQRTSNAENISIWWRHHGILPFGFSLHVTRNKAVLLPRCWAVARVSGDVITNSCNIKVLLYCTEALRGHRVVWKIEIYYLIRMT